ncbi:DNA polymerase III subunit beta [Pseudaminobacter sp. NGMCC 1.201702]|uniref:DNA polymerase III subunit beta n=1 Tax=Pseudaminobacter sp. NGMCC 1.201702 TaxID=3391825 RepID=UPI0039EF2741
MRISLPRHDLAHLLSHVTKAVPSRNTIPVLGTVRLIARDGKLTVTGTNMDLEISGSIEADTPEPLEACVDAKLLSAAAGKAPGETITIEADSGHILVKAGRSRVKLDVLPVDDFPTMEAGEFAAEFEVDAAALFAPVAFAMSDEQTRYYLCGAYLEPTAITATNGHKLSSVAHELIEFAPVIVPSATVAIAPKGKATVRVSERKIQFVAEGITITSKLIDGTYPDYERVIPKNLENVAVYDNATMKAAAERVAIVSQDKSPSVRLDLTSEEITLTARGNGEADDVVSCAYDGPAQAVGFNARYLAEVLGALPAGDVRMAVGDCMGPVVFTSDAAPEQRVVCMPQRVS